MSTIDPSTIDPSSNEDLIDPSTQDIPAEPLPEPPIRITTGLKPLDWLVERRRAGRSKALPPTHLLRQVFEKAKNFDEAQQMLSDSPIAIPALFTLAGADGRSVVIERLEDRYRHRTAPNPTAIANHWPDLPGHDGPWPRGWLRGVDSAGRFRDACVWAGGLEALDALDELGGQCTALYPEKPIYDIPGHPSILAQELIEKLKAQAAPFAPTYHLGLPSLPLYRHLNIL